MRKKAVSALILLLVFCFLGIGSVLAAPVVYIGNIGSDVDKDKWYQTQRGGDTKIDISIRGITNETIDNFSFKILFDASNFVASDAIFESGISSIFPPDANNDDGKVSYNVFPALSFSLQDGLLASFMLKADNKLGDFALSFDKEGFAFGDGFNPVEVISENGGISVVPLPSTILLLGGGLLSLFAARRRRK